MTTTRYLADRFHILSRRLVRSAIVAACVMAWINPLPAGTIYVPNGSFESPSTAFVDPRVDAWQKSPKPLWYDESSGYLWDQLVGLFKNTGPSDPTHIDNCDGSQALFLFALPEVALFQDSLTTDWSHPVPAPEFDARFRVGRTYTLTVGVIGGGGNMTNGVTLDVGLYYRDSASNRVTVASVTITNTPTLFTNTTRFIDFQVRVPAVKAADAWAGRHIGIQFLSSVRPNLASGYWDVDNVRLAETIEVPNGSFESPSTAFADPRVDAWQKTPKPSWYDESGGYLWDQLVGQFANTAPGSADHIPNCDGSQAVWLFAVPEAGIFQDYDSTDWTNAAPTHAFDVRFEAGRSYTLTVGVLGGLGNMLEGVRMQAGLYYRDGASNRVAVASTNIVYTKAAFTNTENQRLFVDYVVRVPTVRAEDPWADQRLGVELLSTVQPSLVGGYWDLDHVRLAEVLEPVLTASAATNGQLTLTIKSDPGLRFEVLASTNLSAAPAAWTSVGTVTNVTGTVSLGLVADSPGRFYQTRRIP